MEHIYIHLPFCASRCGYCDFFSQAGGLERAPAYVDALLEELEAAAGEGLGAGGIDTVYLGGGTPTLIGAGLLGKLLAVFSGRLGGGAEVTVEANPATVTVELAAGLVAAGVNRVSLGVQSFDPRLRRNLERAGSAAAVESAVTALRQAGIRNLSLDLMFSIPEQTAADLDSDLKQALALEPEHISCYELTVKPGSGFMRRWQSELEAAAGHGADFYETVAGTLEGAGYRWYETSNFALEGRECRHNLAYWESADFLGLGAGAWSTAGGRRWRNVDDVASYISAAKSGDWPGAREYEELDSRQRLAERLMLGLRCDTGVDRGAVAGAIDIAQENILQRNGFIVNEGARIFLTRRGRFVANEVCARLLRE